mmetsp:Transcript_5834/g.10319  ORF Transcript_5834/g.10319 Transcript_5834/m.10319 type:complete len:265 (-) Transcript_5834:373-1167(-)
MERVNTIFGIQSVPFAIPTMKKISPNDRAYTEIAITKWWISIWRVVTSPPDDAARPAIRPNTVRSPVMTTTPVAVPSTARVPKKAKFFVSRGLSSVQSTLRACGSDSPVREELSTFSFETLIMRKSAGTLSPSLISTTSPTTKSAAGTCNCLPSRCTSACGGKKFANISIVFSDLNSCINEKIAVTNTTPVSTHPRIKLSEVELSSPYPKKHRIAATVNNMEKKLVNCNRSLTHQGVTFGGESTFGPSFASFSFALADVSPSSG